MCLLNLAPLGPVCNSGWWRMSLSSSHPTNMDHYGPSLTNRFVFSILRPKDQCVTPAGGKCLYHPNTLPTWTIMDLVWDIYVASQSHHLSSSVLFCLVKNVYHPATLPTWTIMPLVWEIDVCSQSHPLRTSVLLCLVENVSIIQPPYPHGPLWT